jgi:uncharacterized integral membrane protein
MRSISSGSSAVALLVFAMVFMLQNAAPTEVNLFFWQVVLPRCLLILAVLLTGIIIGWFIRAVLGTWRKHIRRARRMARP